MKTCFDSIGLAGVYCIYSLALANSRVSRLFEDKERQSDLLRRPFWSILLIERFDVLDLSGL